MKSEKIFSVFTWHIHGTYLYYLSQGPFRIFIPVTDTPREGYYGRGETFPFGDNVTEVPAEEVKYMQFDCILFQSNKNWLTDQYDILSPAQRSLPRIYVEHDPPWSSPTEAVHIVKDPSVIMVHVSHFNKLMWDNNNHIVKVIDHGVINPGVKYQGSLEKGIVVVNHLHQRGRKLGADIFDKVRKIIPLDLIGMGTEAYGGLGEILHTSLPAFISQYRFFFNPIRYTSMGLAVIEAMMTGLPVAALATTEYVTVIKDGENGFIATDPDYLIRKMEWLLEDRVKAAELGEKGRQYVFHRFNIERFIQDWEKTFELATSKKKIYDQDSIHQ